MGERHQASASLRAQDGRRSVRDLWPVPVCRAPRDTGACSSSARGRAREVSSMKTRAQLRRQRSSLAQAWDLNVRALGRQTSDDLPGGVRTEIASSWQRSARHVSPNVTQALLTSDGDTRAAWESSPLSAAVRRLEAELRAAADDGDLVIAVTDPRARILWTHGGRVMRRHAERVNFVPGGRWDEASVGTNALDLALRLDRTATVYSAEHFSSCVHDWVCYAAPVHDPRTGQQLGVLDLSTTWD